MKNLVSHHAFKMMQGVCKAASVVELTFPFSKAACKILLMEMINK